MDSPHAIGFYVSSALSVGGGIAVAFLGTRTRRALALLVAGVGVAGVDASLSAGFAAAVVLVRSLPWPDCVSGPGGAVVSTGQVLAGRPSTPQH